jgi:hypothetical protein
VTAGCGLPEEFPMRRFTCIERENWYGSRQIGPRAFGCVKRQTGFGFGSNGVTLSDHHLTV